MAAQVAIVAMGACTPVGRNAWSSAAAVRAGISGANQHPYMTDTAGEPVSVATAPWLDIDLSGQARFEALLFPAIDQVFEAVHPVGADMRIGLALGLPNPRPGLPEGLQQRIAKAVAERYPNIFSATAYFPHGHAAGFLALEAAFKKLTQGGLDACVVAAVDSYVAPETLVWLEASDQLHGAGSPNNAWGFIPGEAAGALLLTGETITHRLGLAPLARLLGTGSAIETKRIKTATVCIGEGLTQAFQNALAALPAGAKVTDIYCDMNGEPYRADEYGFACMRTKEYFEAAADFVAPADCWGDVSAAGAPLHLILAMIAGSKGYANGNLAFAWASGEAGERASVLVLTG
jgi:3-oxoacyl-[acyl-carrier-protein] synthase I